MNKRIRELALQAGGIWRAGYVEQPNGDSVWVEKKSIDAGDMDVDQFAALILKDVVDICNKQKWQCAFQSYRDGINDVKHQIELVYGAKE